MTTTDISEVYRRELRFLLKLKESVGLLNNRIHDNLALIAIEHLKQQHNDLTFRYTNAGASGIDIKADDSTGQIRLVAEVKTTLPDSNGRLRGPQTSHIQKDLERLAQQTKVDYRYLVLLSSSTKSAVRHQLQTDSKYPSIKIFKALEDNLSEQTSEDE